jgi:Adenylate and Guanylate cyclase catalytic domain
MDIVHDDYQAHYDAATATVICQGFLRLRGTEELETMLEMTTEHADALEADLQSQAEALARWSQFIRETFGRYVSEDVAAQLLDAPEGLEFGGAKRKVTILMSDMQGFTALAECLEPQEIMTFLNRYLEAMVDVILVYRGTIIEILGDGLLVLFGAPLTRDDDAERAVACALAMQFMRGTHSLSLPTPTETLIPLPQTLDVHYAVLEGKFAGSALYGGRMVKCATRTAELHVDQPVAAFSNLKLRLLRPTGEVVPGDLFAKMVETLPTDASRVVVRFTSIPEATRTFLDTMRGYEYHVINRAEQV